MDKIIQTSVKERQQVFTETAVKRGVTPAVIEKDFWSEYPIPIMGCPLK